MSSDPQTDQVPGLFDTLEESASSPGVAPGVVFVLAAGGVRHLERSGSGFLGYPSHEVFWSDALDLVHEEDLARVKAVISEVVDNPGDSLSTELRFLDASGAWRLMDTTVQNVLEAPGDTGLVVVNVRPAAGADQN